MSWRGRRTARTKRELKAPMCLTPGARPRHALPGVVALRGVAPQRLLADDVLARLRGGDRRLGVQVVGPRVVEQADALVLEQRVPVGHMAGEAVASSGLGHGLLVAPGDGH